MILKSIYIFLYQVKRPSSKTLRLPSPQCQIRVDRRLTSQRKRNVPASNVPRTARPLKIAQIKARLDAIKSSDCERLAIMRSMVAATDRTLMRGKMALAQNQAVRRAAEERRKQMAIELAPTFASSRRTCQRLNALMRERMRENRVWLKQIKDGTWRTLQPKQNLKPEYESSPNADGNFSGPEVSSATTSVNKDEADLTPSEASGLALNLEKDCRGTNQEESLTLANDAMSPGKDKQVLLELLYFLDEVITD